MTASNAPTHSVNGQASVGDEENEVSLIALLTLLLRRRATIVWSSILCAALFTGYSLIGDRTWTTAVSFFPQGKKLSTACFYVRVLGK